VKAASGLSELALDISRACCEQVTKAPGWASFATEAERSIFTRAGHSPPAHYVCEVPAFGGVVSQLGKSDLYNSSLQFCDSPSFRVHNTDSISLVHIHVEPFPLSSASRSSLSRSHQHPRQAFPAFISILGNHVRL